MRSFFVFIIAIGQLARASAEEASVMIPKSSLIENPIALSSQNELEVIGNLILSTQGQLEKQIELKRIMIEFNQQEEDFVNGLQTKAHAAKMVRTARKILEMITDLHLQHLFLSQYMDELTVFASIAGKNTPPRP